MTVREYIGARYVPLFMGDWSDETTYEPLSIVQYQGNSYTSCQYVPTGIAIDNEVYWAETGNYNAQVEAYRAEVQQFDSRITANAEAITAMAGIAYVGNYGAVENSSDNDWESIISAIAEVSTTISFGCGSWDVKEGITIPSSIKKISACGARIYTSEDSCDYLFKLEGFFHMVNGFQFENYSKAEKIIYIANNNGASVTDCMFMGIGHNNYGIYSDGIGIQASDCLFFGSTTKVNDSYPYIGGIGIKAHTDNIISNCKLFNLDYDFLVNGANISNCYGYAKGSFDGNRETEGVFVAPELYLVNSGEKTTDISITNCELDCIQRCVVNPRNVVMNDNIFYWNPNDNILRDCYLFFADGVTSMQGIVFNNNIVKGNSITHNVNSFGCSAHINGNQAVCNINNYLSEGNNFRSDVYNEVDLTKYNITAGWNAPSIQNSSGTKYYTHIAMNGLNTSTNNPVYTLIGSTFGLKYGRDANNRDLVSLVKNLRNGNQYINVYYDTNEKIDEYIGIGGTSMERVELTSTPYFNINMGNITTQPDLTGYTEMKIYQLDMTQVS